MTSSSSEQRPRSTSASVTPAPTSGLVSEARSNTVSGVIVRGRIDARLSERLVQHHVAVVPHECYGAGDDAGVDRRADDRAGVLHVPGSAALSLTSAWRSAAS